MLSILLLFSPPTRAAPGFEDTVQGARAVSPTAQMGAEDLIMARHRFAQSIARLLPAISASDNYTYRYSNPDLYSFGDDGSGESCDPEADGLCLPFTVIDGQVTIPDNSHSNSLSLSASLPVSAAVITSAMQQKNSQELTELQVLSQEEQLIQQVVGLYGDLQYTVGALVMYEESLALARETLTAVAGEHAVGEATDLDRDQARLDVDDAALTITQINRALPLMLEEIALVSGQEDGDGASVCPFPEDVDTGQPLDISGATSLANALVQLDMDKLDRTSSRLDLLPSLTLMGGLSWSGSGADPAEVSDNFIFNYWYVSGNLSMTLFDGFGGYHSRREAASSLRKTQLDVDYDQQSLDLDDRGLALDLLDLSEDIALTERSIALQEREVQASRALYFDGGQVPFDMYVQSRSLLEQLQLQLLSLRNQQQQLTTSRWASAGQIDALLSQLYDIERANAAAGRCRDLTRPTRPTP